jgi:hypothetical protein
MATDYAAKLEALKAQNTSPPPVKDLQWKGRGTILNYLLISCRMLRLRYIIRQLILTD